MSLYDEIGGDAALDAALDVFYPKILGDPRSSYLFAGVDLEWLRNHAKAFMAMAFGGPNKYHGQGLRKAHERPRSKGLTDPHFEVFLEHFAATLEQLSVPPPQATQILAIAAGAREEVLDR
jgi:hemoglobin